MRALLKQGADVSAAEGDGTTALHWAARAGDAELVQVLVYAGANVRATTRLGAYTPLMMAAQAGQPAAVAALIAGGADVKATSTTGTTPLMFAAQSGDTRTVTMLVEGGSDVNARETAMGQTPLMFAVAYNRVDVVRLLLARGADVQATSKVVDLTKLSSPEEEFCRPRRQGPERRRRRPAAARTWLASHASIGTTSWWGLPAASPPCISRRGRGSSTWSRRWSRPVPTSTS